MFTHNESESDFVKDSGVSDDFVPSPLDFAPDEPNNGTVVSCHVTNITLADLLAPEKSVKIPCSWERYAVCRKEPERSS